MKELLLPQGLRVDEIGQDFEKQGWTAITPCPEVRQHYRNFLKLSHEFFNGDLVKNQKLVNKRGFVFPGFLTYPGGRDGYFHDTTQMFHVGLFENEKVGPDNIPSFMRHANIWPDFQEFKDSFIVLRNYFFSLSKEILSAVEKYYLLPEGDLSTLIDDGWSVQRSMIYGPSKDESRIGNLTVGEHRDTSLLTITLGGSQIGLELKNFLGDWEEISNDNSKVIIGVGGMLEQIVNGNFKCMFHRVKYTRETMEKSRVSTPFFCWPRPEAVLTPHPLILERYKQTPRYPTQLTINHLEQNLMVPFSYPDDKELIKNYLLSTEKVA